MAAYNYQALDAEGKKVKGVLEADSERQVRLLLREQKLKPMVVTEAGNKGKARVEKGDKPSFMQGSRHAAVKISSSELCLITRQLATLVQSSLPLAEALQAAAQQSVKPKVKGMLLDVRGRVLEGHTLAYGMAEFPKVFDELYCSMVRAGESAGFLGKVLEQLADYTESSHHSRQQMTQAMMYPSVLVVFALCVVGGLMTFVVPDLIAIFENTESELPILTRGLIACSDFFSNWGLLTFAIIGGLFFSFKMLLRKPSRLYRWHQLKLRLPLIGGVIRSSDTTRFASTLSILMASGVPLLQGLKIAGEVLTNRVLRKSCAEVAMKVQEGGSLSRALASTEQFPPMMVHMIASGEASGELESMLERCATNQGRELDAKLGTLMSAFEPLIVVLMGGAVLMIVIAVLLPIFEMNNLVG
ncbi:general secretion pathway protein F [Sinobacterium caligoides]|uniref:General secretion pathway protein F n=1 Tax=Sinobacterium caligoides TaxID=933926 RepID=A0A3N2DNG6_9GAMM|nr:type II secretion system inner membrane protein GspF [Sinobacterium caligoides]ROS01347.1 general secretion pathway protein F [Sinobacterium caligoides]